MLKSYFKLVAKLYNSICKLATKNSQSTYQDRAVYDNFGITDNYPGAVAQSVATESDNWIRGREFDLSPIVLARTAVPITHW